MPASPDMAREVALMVRRIYEAAEARVFERIVAAVTAGLDAPDWQVAQQGEYLAVLAELDRYLQGLDEQAPALFTRAVAQAYTLGEEAARLDLTAAGIDHAPIGGPRASWAVQALAEDRAQALAGMRPRIMRSVRDVYQQVTADIAAQVLTGAMDRREAARAALRAYADRSITGFRDASGRRWDLASYAEMTTRTTAGQAAIQGHTDQLRDLGQDLVKVSKSPESCEACGRWQGRVLSLTGQTTGRLKDGVTVAGTITEARRAGLQHPNCTHTVGLYLPGYSRRAEATPADPALYEVRQQQRAQERAIRRAKRAAIIDAQTLGPTHPRTVQSRRALRDRQAAHRQWREAHGRKDLAYRRSTVTR